MDMSPDTVSNLIEGLFMVNQAKQAHMVESKEKIANIVAAMILCFGPNRFILNYPQEEAIRIFAQEKRASHSSLIDR